MTALRFVWLLVALAGSIGPGLLLVRRWRMGSLERLCAAAVISQAVIYLFSGLIYVTGAPPWANVAVAVGCLGCCAAARTEIHALARARQSRRAAMALGLLFGWVLLLLGLVRSFSGGRWAWDWMEHYERTHFFVAHLALDTRFIGIYSLPARPPLMNLVAAHFLAASADRYEFFQVVFCFLNVLVLLPAALLCRQLLGRTKRDALAVLFCLFALSPFFLQNATYAWTKSLANFDVLAGLWFYLRGTQRNDPLRLALGLGALAAGVLVHYSAAPFALFVGAHFLVWVARRREPRARALVLLLPAAAMAGTWIAWSLAHYGFAGTFASNTTVSGGGLEPGGFASRFAWNLWYSIVPHPLRMSPGVFRIDYFQPSAIGYLRDYLFTVLQTNAVFALGTVGGVLALWLAARRRLTGFWIGFVATGLAAIAAHPTLEVTGVAHVCSQPLVIVGLVFLATEWDGMPRWGRAALAAGAAFDFGVGVFLHFSVENWAGRMSPGGNGLLVPDLTTDMPNRWAVEGWLAKYSRHYSFFGDHFAGAVLVLEALVLAGAATAILAMAGRSRRRTGGAAAALLLGTGVSVMAIASRPGVPVSIPAAADLQAALAANPDRAQTWTDAGVDLLRKGNVGGAVRSWGEAFALDPRPGLARYYPESIASSYELKLPPTAVAAESVLRHPGAAGTWVDLAAARFARGHREPAIAALNEALRLDPGNEVAKASLANLTK